MNISTKFEEGKGPLEGAFQIHIPQQEVDQHFLRAYHKMQHRTNLKGFRKGKIPKQHLWEMYGQQIAIDSTQIMAVKAYEQALAKHGFIPLGEPHFHISSPAQEEEDFNFKVEFELSPHFDSIQYDNLSLPTAPPPPTEEEIEKRLNADLISLCDALATYENVEDTQVKATKDHTAVLDLTAVDEKGQKIDSFELQSFHLSLKECFLNKAFMEQILGMKWKEHKEFELDLEKEKETHFLESEETINSLKGFSKVRVSAKMKALKIKHSPLLNDLFVKESFNLESVQALRDHLKESIVQKKKNEAKELLKTNIFSALLKKNPFSLPPKFLKNKQDQMTDEIRENFKKKGLSKRAIQSFIEEGKASLEKRLEENIKINILIPHLAKQQDFHCREEDIEEIFNLSVEEGRAEAKDWEKTKKFMEKDGEEQIKMKFHIIERKVLDFVMTANNLSFVK